MKTDMLQVLLLQMSEQHVRLLSDREMNIQSFQESFWFFFSFLWNTHFKLAVTADPLTLDLVLLAEIHRK